MPEQQTDISWDLARSGQQIIEEVKDYAIFLLDPQGHVMSWNKGGRMIKGYTDSEIRGRHFSIFYTPEDQARGLPELEMQTARREGRSESEGWRVRKDGKRLWVNEVITALHDPPGSLAGFLKIARDLSEQKRVQDALRESEQRYRAVIEGVKDYGIFTMDANRAVLTWNNAARRLMGYSEDQIVGRSADIIFTPEDRAMGAPELEMRRALIEGRAENERWHMRQGGSRFWGSGVLTAMRDEDGYLIGFSKILRDQTDRKRLEDDRSHLLKREQVAREAAEETTRLKDEFLAVVSHELRTPLAAILLWSKLLRAGMLDETARVEAVSVIEQSARSQHALIEDLLDVSRILSGKLRLNLAPTDLRAVVRAALEAVEPMAQAKSITIQADLDEPLDRVRADADRMQQVVWNLLTNAVKFTAPAGRIIVRARREDDHVHIAVSDTGTGISPAFLPHVFDRFRQADSSTTRAEGGLGLGLSISKQLVELHGGTITAASEGAGNGATFTVTLPIGELGPVVTDRVKSNPVRAPAVARPLQGKWVLLVEDDSATRRAVTWVLEQAGAEVTAVPSAEEAIRGLAADMKGKRPDVLVGDIGMPGQDGYEMMRRLRALEVERSQPPMPAAALTAYARSEDRDRALAAGFNTFIAKPFEPEQLVRTVGEMASASQGRAPRPLREGEIGF